MFLEFFYFRCNDKGVVGVLVVDFLIVILMVDFGRVEGFEWYKLCYYWVFLKLWSGFGNGFFGYGFLCVIVVEDDRVVLWALVVVLLVEGGWVVDGLENIEYLSVGNDLWVKLDLYDFGVLCGV